MTAHQRALDDLREYLTENVDLTYGILWDFLRQNQVVSLEERETIQDRSDSNADQVDHLINLLRIREEANTRRFIQALEQTDHHEVAVRLGNRIDFYKASVSGLYRAALEGSLKALLYLLILFVLGQNLYFNIKELYTNYKCRPIADQFVVRYGKITLWGSSEPWTVPTSTIMTPCAIVQNNRSLTGLTTTAVYCFYDVLKYKPPYYILVTGEVGRGKTTLSRQVALHWAERILEGPHFQFPVSCVKLFDLILPVELKHVTKNDTLQSLLRREFRFVGQNALNYLLSVVSNSPDRVLFLFDGLDEMSKNASKDILSILKREDNTLRLNMIITTREHAANIIRPSLGKNDIELQLTGFEWQHISQYVTRFFSDKDPRMGHDLLRHLWVNVELQSMAQSPMLLQLLCMLRLKGKSEINHRTSVYTEYLFIELNRFRHEKHPDLRRLSRHELLLEYKESLMKLGALYFADCEGKQFQSVFDLWCIEDKVGKEVFSLGLLDTSVPSAPYDAKHVGFIHRSFQEYLAALVIFLGDSVSEEVLVKHCVTPELLNEKKTILQFLAGLSSDTSNRVMQKIQVSLSNFGENLNLYQSSDMLYAYRESLVWYSQWKIVYDVFLSVLLEHRDMTQVNFSFVSLHLKTNSPEINIIYNYTKANPSILRNLHAIIVDGSDHSTITTNKECNKTQNIRFYDIFDLAVKRPTLRIFEIVPSEFFIYLSLFYGGTFTTKITNETTLVFDESRIFNKIWIPSKSSVSYFLDNPSIDGVAGNFTHVIVRGNNKEWSYERILLTYSNVENMWITSTTCRYIVGTHQDKKIASSRKHSKIRHLTLDLSACIAYEEEKSFTMLNRLPQLEHIHFQGTKRNKLLINQLMLNARYLTKRFPNVKLKPSFDEIINLYLKHDL